MKNWKLTLPIDKAGSNKGVAVEIKPIPENYKSAYFYRTEKGDEVFICPVDGATTKGSKYPRSEMRELDNNGKEIAWKIDGKTHSLKRRVKISGEPITEKKERGRLVIGQIHGKEDELCRLYYENGGIYFIVDKVGAAKKETRFDFKSKFRRNQFFDYAIRVENKTLRVFINEEVVSYNIEPHWFNDTFYFKYGVYSGVGRIGGKAGTKGTGIGKAVFKYKKEDASPFHG